MNSLGNATKVSYYQQKIEARREAIEAILFNEDVGIWQDYSLKTNKSRDYFYMSNIFPIFMNCVDLTSERREQIWKYIKVLLFCSFVLSFVWI